MRKLPLINLAGTDFTIDVRMGELKNTTSPFNSIPFRNMEPTEEGYHYQFWYDTEAKGIHLGSVDPNNVPTHLVQMQIPWEIRMDPIGMALHKNLPPSTFTQFYPVVERFEGTILESKPGNQLIKRIQSAKQRIAKSFSPNKRLKR